MVYLNYISCWRYTILVGNSQCIPIFNQQLINMICTGAEFHMDGTTGTPHHKTQGNCIDTLFNVTHQHKYNYGRTCSFQLSTTPTATRDKQLCMQQVILWLQLFLLEKGGLRGVGGGLGGGGGRVG